MRVPDAASERRLEQLRRDAAAGIASGYYGLPLLKPPVWTWEVPAYFFAGGTAGAAAMIAFAARVTGGAERLVRHAQWIAAAGAAVSGPLLIADLGRPERFLNMLRVFKPQSPMSVGAWLLAAFGPAAVAAIVTRGTMRNIASATAALTGLGMATYTGVLLGATAIPAWAQNAAVLPAQFGASSLASAAGLLELAGHCGRALHRIGVISASAETVLHRGRGKATTARFASAFSGPVPLLMRLVGGRSKRVRQAAAASALLGSILTRIAWIEAGRSSARGDAARPREAIGK